MYLIIYKKISYIKNLLSIVNNKIIQNIIHINKLHIDERNINLLFNMSLDVNYNRIFK